MGESPGALRAGPEGWDLEECGEGRMWKVGGVAGTEVGRVVLPYVQVAGTSSSPPTS